MRKIKKRGKKAQQSLQLPFGMIFSILLIIAFLAVAFIAIKYFLNLQKEILINTFYDDFQKKVDSVWKAQTAENVPFTGKLPKKIEAVCFTDFASSAAGVDKEKYTDFRRYKFTESNMFFYPIDKTNKPNRQIKHLNVEKSTSEQNKNPLCFENQNGEVTIHLSINFETSVTIS